VRSKKETLYCYSEEERLSALAKLGTNPEITRFKGLGEISPDEFQHFIGKEHATGSGIPEKRRCCSRPVIILYGEKILPNARILLSITWWWKKT